MAFKKERFMAQGIASGTGDAERHRRVDSIDSWLSVAGISSLYRRADFGPHLALTEIVRLPRKIKCERKYEHTNGNDSQVRRSQPR